ncbi:MAG: DUF134 domain-containing protein [Oceanipulchritudo sp.]
MRPTKCRYIDLDPNVAVFKPRGIPSRELKTVELQLDELEAIRLADYKGLHHAVAGKRMGVSRATFGRILEQARHKIAEALLNGKALQFGGGEVLTARKRRYLCHDCGDRFTVQRRSKPPASCPSCESPRLKILSP